jgi:small subunit ribosomal protein S12
MSVLNRKIFKKKKKNNKSFLFKCPQKKGLCLVFFTRTPRKPNSARRKCVWVNLSNLKRVGVYIPGIGYNIQKFSSVLVRGKGPKDLPGIKFRLVRNCYDLLAVSNRFNARSKYGCIRIKYTHKLMDSLSLIPKKFKTKQSNVIEDAIKAYKENKSKNLASNGKANSK